MNQEKPSKSNAVLVCDKCGTITDKWNDKCMKCNHDMMNVCLDYTEANALRKKISPKSQTGRARAYRRRAESPRERGPKVIQPQEHREP